MTLFNRTKSLFARLKKNFFKINIKILPPSNGYIGKRFMLPIKKFISLRTKSLHNNQKQKFILGPDIKTKNFFLLFNKLKSIIFARNPNKPQIIFFVRRPNNFAIKTCAISCVNRQKKIIINFFRRFTSRRNNKTKKNDFSNSNFT